MSEPQFQLVIRKGPQVGQVFHLDAHSLIIGRDPMSDITINDPEISRQHARFTLTEEGFQIEDLGSTNGTFVNGQRLGSEPFALQPGQAINMGSGVRLVYELAGTLESDVDTMVDEVPPWAAVPLVETESPDAPPNPAPAFSAPPTYPSYQYPASAPPSQSSPDPHYNPFVPPGEPPNKNRRNMTIVVVVLLLLCCCCTFIGFMYQWGGDWLLQYLGIY
ncbi:MAG TPA: FHA domain-containing protein [Chloroflexota bacterium]|nr:FHA domain-containing protein [Chloroflexota bacterium]HUM71734.1 FHA domain-containing protein [Chloroflexota bacterium]